MAAEADIPELISSFKTEEEIKYLVSEHPELARPELATIVVIETMKAASDGRLQILDSASRLPSQSETVENAGEETCRISEKREMNEIPLLAEKKTSQNEGQVENDSIIQLNEGTGPEESEASEGTEKEEKKTDTNHSILVPQGTSSEERQTDSGNEADDSKTSDGEGTNTDKNPEKTLANEGGIEVIKVVDSIGDALTSTAEASSDPKSDDKVLLNKELDDPTATMSSRRIPANEEQEQLAEASSATVEGNRQADAESIDKMPYVNPLDGMQVEHVSDTYLVAKAEDQCLEIVDILDESKAVTKIQPDKVGEESPKEENNVEMDEKTNKVDGTLSEVSHGDDEKVEKMGASNDKMEEQGLGSAGPEADTGDTVINRTIDATNQIQNEKQKDEISRDSLRESEESGTETLAEHLISAISEDDHSVASSENAEMKTCLEDAKIQEEKFEEEGDGDKPPHLDTYGEHGNPEKKNHPPLKTIEETEAMEIGIAKQNSNEFDVNHSLTEKDMQNKSEKLDTYSNSEIEEPTQEVNDASNAKDEKALESYESRESTISERRPTDNASTAELKSHEMDKAAEDIKDVIVKEESSNEERHEIATRGNIIEKGIITTEKLVAVDSAVTCAAETTESQVQVDSLVTKSILAGEEHGYNLEDDMQNSAEVQESTKITESGEMTEEQIKEASSAHLPSKSTEELVEGYKEETDNANKSKEEVNGELTKDEGEKETSPELVVGIPVCDVQYDDKATADNILDPQGTHLEVKRRDEPSEETLKSSENEQADLKTKVGEGIRTNENLDGQSNNQTVDTIDITLEKKQEVSPDVAASSMKEAEAGVSQSCNTKRIEDAQGATFEEFKDIESEKNSGIEDGAEATKLVDSLQDALMSTEAESVDLASYKTLKIADRNKEELRVPSMDVSSGCEPAHEEDVKLAEAPTVTAEDMRRDDTEPIDMQDKNISDMYPATKPEEQCLQIADIDEVKTSMDTQPNNVIQESPEEDNNETEIKEETAQVNVTVSDECMGSESNKLGSCMEREVTEGIYEKPELMQSSDEKREGEGWAAKVAGADSSNREINQSTNATEQIHIGGLTDEEITGEGFQQPDAGALVNAAFEDSHSAASSENAEANSKLEGEGRHEEKIEEKGEEKLPQPGASREGGIPEEKNDQPAEIYEMARDLEVETANKNANGLDVNSSTEKGLQKEYETHETSSKSETEEPTHQTDDAFGGKEKNGEQSSESYESTGNKSSEKASTDETPTTDLLDAGKSSEKNEAVEGIKDVIEKEEAFSGETHEMEGEVHADALETKTMLTGESKIYKSEDADLGNSTEVHENAGIICSGETIQEQITENMSSELVEEEIVEGSKDDLKYADMSSKEHNAELIKDEPEKDTSAESVGEILIQDLENVERPEIAADESVPYGTYQTAESPKDLQSEKQDQNPEEANEDKIAMLLEESGHIGRDEGHKAEGSKESSVSESEEDLKQTLKEHDLQEKLEQTLSVTSDETIIKTNNTNLEEDNIQNPEQNEQNEERVKGVKDVDGIADIATAKEGHDAQTPDRCKSTESIISETETRAVVEKLTEGDSFVSKEKSEEEIIREEIKEVYQSPEIHDALQESVAEETSEGFQKEEEEKSDAMTLEQLETSKACEDADKHVLEDNSINESGTKVKQVSEEGNTVAVTPKKEITQASAEEIEEMHKADGSRDKETCEDDEENLETADSMKGLTQKPGREDHKEVIETPVTEILDNKLAEVIINPSEEHKQAFDEARETIDQTQETRQGQNIDKETPPFTQAREETLIQKEEDSTNLPDVSEEEPVEMEKQMHEDLSTSKQVPEMEKTREQNSNELNQAAIMSEEDQKGVKEGLKSKNTEELAMEEGSSTQQIHVASVTDVQVDEVEAGHLVAEEDTTKEKENFLITNEAEEKPDEEKEKPANSTCTLSEEPKDAPDCDMTVMETMVEVPAETNSSNINWDGKIGQNNELEEVTPSDLASDFQIKYLDQLQEQNLTVTLEQLGTNKTCEDADKNVSGEDYSIEETGTKEEETSGEGNTVAVTSRKEITEASHEDQEVEEVRQEDSCTVKDRCGDDEQNPETADSVEGVIQNPEREDQKEGKETSVAEVSGTKLTEEHTKEFEEARETIDLTPETRRGPNEDTETPSLTKGQEGILIQKEENPTNLTDVSEEKPVELQKQMHENFSSSKEVLEVEETREQNESELNEATILAEEDQKGVKKGSNGENTEELVIEEGCSTDKLHIAAVTDKQAHEVEAGHLVPEAATTKEMESFLITKEAEEKTGEDKEKPASTCTLSEESKDAPDCDMTVTETVVKAPTETRPSNINLDDNIGGSQNKELQEATYSDLASNLQIKDQEQVQQQNSTVTFEHLQTDKTSEDADKHVEDNFIEQTGSKGEHTPGEGNTVDLTSRKELTEASDQGQEIEKVRQEECCRDKERGGDDEQNPADPTEGVIQKPEIEDQKEGKEASAAEVLDTKLIEKHKQEFEEARETTDPPPEIRRGPNEDMETPSFTQGEERILIQREENPTNLTDVFEEKPAEAEKQMHEDFSTSKEVLELEETVEQNESELNEAAILSEEDQKGVKKGSNGEHTEELVIKEGKSTQKLHIAAVTDMQVHEVDAAHLVVEEHNTKEKENFLITTQAEEKTDEDKEKPASTSTLSEESKDAPNCDMTVTETMVEVPAETSSSNINLDDKTGASQNNELEEVTSSNLAYDFQIKDLKQVQEQNLTVTLEQIGTNKTCEDADKNVSEEDNSTEDTGTKEEQTSGEGNTVDVTSRKVITEASHEGQEVEEMHQEDRCTVKDRCGDDEQNPETADSVEGVIQNPEREDQKEGKETFVAEVSDTKLTEEHKQEFEEERQTIDLTPERRRCPNEDTETPSFTKGKQSILIQNEENPTNLTDVSEENPVELKKQMHENFSSSKEVLKVEETREQNESELNEATILAVEEDQKGVKKGSNGDNTEELIMEEGSSTDKLHIAAVTDEQVHEVVAGHLVPEEATTKEMENFLTTKEAEEKTDEDKEKPASTCTLSEESKDVPDCEMTVMETLVKAPTETSSSNINLDDNIGASQNKDLGEVTYPDLASDLQIKDHVQVQQQNSTVTFEQFQTDKTSEDADKHVSEKDNSIEQTGSKGEHSPREGNAIDVTSRKEITEASDEGQEIEKMRQEECCRDNERGGDHEQNPADPMEGVIQTPEIEDQKEGKEISAAEVLDTKLTEEHKQEFEEARETIDPTPETWRGPNEDTETPSFTQGEERILIQKEENPTNLTDVFEEKPAEAEKQMHEDFSTSKEGLELEETREQNGSELNEAAILSEEDQEGVKKGSNGEDTEELVIKEGKSTQKLHIAAVTDVKVHEVEAGHLVAEEHTTKEKQNFLITAEAEEKTDEDKEKPASTSTLSEESKDAPNCDMTVTETMVEVPAETSSSNINLVDKIGASQNNEIKEVTSSNLAYDFQIKNLKQVQEQNLTVTLEHIGTNKTCEDADKNVLEEDNSTEETGTKEKQTSGEGNTVDVTPRKEITKASNEGQEVEEVRQEDHCTVKERCGDDERNPETADSVEGVIQNPEREDQKEGKETSVAEVSDTKLTEEHKQEFEEARQTIDLTPETRQGPNEDTETPSLTKGQEGILIQKEENPTNLTDVSEEKPVELQKQIHENFSSSKEVLEVEETREQNESELNEATILAVEEDQKGVKKGSNGDNTEELVMEEGSSTDKLHIAAMTDEQVHEVVAGHLVPEEAMTKEMENFLITKEAEEKTDEDKEKPASTCTLSEESKDAPDCDMTVMETVVKVPTDTSSSNIILDDNIGASQNKELEEVTYSDLASDLQIKDHEKVQQDNSTVTFQQLETDKTSEYADKRVPEEDNSTEQTGSKGEHTPGEGHTVDVTSRNEITEASDEGPEIEKLHQEECCRDKESGEDDEHNPELADPTGGVIQKPEIEDQKEGKETSAAEVLDTKLTEEHKQEFEEARETIDPTPETRRGPNEDTETTSITQGEERLLIQKEENPTNLTDVFEEKPDEAEKQIHEDFSTSKEGLELEETREQNGSELNEAAILSEEDQKGVKKGSNGEDTEELVIKEGKCTQKLHIAAVTDMQVHEVEAGHLVAEENTTKEKENFLITTQAEEKTDEDKEKPASTSSLSEESKDAPICDMTVTETMVEVPASSSNINLDDKIGASQNNELKEIGTRKTCHDADKNVLEEYNPTEETGTKDEQTSGEVNAVEVTSRKEITEASHECQEVEEVHQEDRCTVKDRCGDDEQNPETADSVEGVIQNPEREDQKEGKETSVAEVSGTKLTEEHKKEFEEARETIDLTPETRRGPNEDTETPSLTKGQGILIQKEENPTNLTDVSEEKPVELQKQMHENFSSSKEVLEVEETREQNESELNDATILAEEDQKGVKKGSNGDNTEELIIEEGSSTDKLHRAAVTDEQVHEVEARHLVPEAATTKEMEIFVITKEAEEKTGEDKEKPASTCTLSEESKDAPDCDMTVTETVVKAPTETSPSNINLDDNIGTSQSKELREATYSDLASDLQIKDHEQVQQQNSTVTFEQLQTDKTSEDADKHVEDNSIEQTGSKGEHTTGEGNTVDVTSRKETTEASDEGQEIEKVSEEKCCRDKERGEYDEHNPEIADPTEGVIQKPKIEDQKEGKETSAAEVLDTKLTEEHKQEFEEARETIDPTPETRRGPNEDTETPSFTQGEERIMIQKEENPTNLTDAFVEKPAEAERQMHEDFSTSKKVLELEETREQNGSEFNEAAILSEEDQNGVNKGSNGEDTEELVMDEGSSTEKPHIAAVTDMQVHEVDAGHLEAEEPTTEEKENFLITIEAEEKTDEDKEKPASTSTLSEESKDAPNCDMTVTETMVEVPAERSSSNINLDDKTGASQNNELEEVTSSNLAYDFQINDLEQVPEQNLTVTLEQLGTNKTCEDADKHVSEEDNSIEETGNKGEQTSGEGNTAAVTSRKEITEATEEGQEIEKVHQDECCRDQERCEDDKQNPETADSTEGVIQKPEREDQKEGKETFIAEVLGTKLTEEHKQESEEASETINSTPETRRGPNEDTETPSFTQGEESILIQKEENPTNLTDVNEEKPAEAEKQMHEDFSTKEVLEVEETREQNGSELNEAAILSKEDQKGVKKGSNGEDTEELVMEEGSSIEKLHIAAVTDVQVLEVQAGHLVAEDPTTKEKENFLITKEAEEKTDENKEKPPSTCATLFKESKDAIKENIIQETNSCNDTVTATTVEVPAEKSSTNINEDDKIDASRNKEFEETSPDLSSPFQTKDLENLTVADEDEATERTSGAVCICKDQENEETDKADESQTVQNLNPLANDRQEADIETAMSETPNVNESRVNELPSDGTEEENEEHKKSLAVEELDSYKIEESQAVSEATSHYGSPIVKSFDKDKITPDAPPIKDKTEEQLHISSSGQPSENQEIRTTDMNGTVEEERKEAKPLESENPEKCSHQNTSTEVCLQEEVGRQLAALPADETTDLQAFSVDKPEEQFPTPSSDQHSEGVKHTPTTRIEETECEKTDEAETMSDESEKDPLEGNTDESIGLQNEGPTDLVAARGDETHADQFLATEELENQIQHTSSELPSREQDSENSENIEEKTKETEKLLDKSPEDASDADRSTTVEACSEKEGVQEHEDTGKDESVSTQSHLAEKVEEHIPSPSSSLPSAEIMKADGPQDTSEVRMEEKISLQKEMPSDYIVALEDETHGLENQISSTSSELPSYEQEGETSMIVPKMEEKTKETEELVLESPVDASGADQNVTAKTYPGKEVLQDIEAFREDESVAPQNLQLEKEEEHIPSSSPGLLPTEAMKDEGANDLEEVNMEECVCLQREGFTDPVAASGNEIHAYQVPSADEQEQKSETTTTVEQIEEKAEEAENLKKESPEHASEVDRSSKNQTVSEHEEVQELEVNRKDEIVAAEILPAGKVEEHSTLLTEDEMDVVRMLTKDSPALHTAETICLENEALKDYQTVAANEIVPSQAVPAEESVEKELISTTEKLVGTQMEEAVKLEDEISKKFLVEKKMLEVSVQEDKDETTAAQTCSEDESEKQLQILSAESTCDETEHDKMTISKNADKEKAEEKYPVAETMKSETSNEGSTEREVAEVVTQAPTEPVSDKQVQKPTLIFPSNEKELHSRTMVEKVEEETKEAKFLEDKNQEPSSNATETEEVCQQKEILHELEPVKKDETATVRRTSITGKPIEFPSPLIPLQPEEQVHQTITKVDAGEEETQEISSAAKTTEKTSLEKDALEEPKVDLGEGTIASNVQSETCKRDFKCDSETQIPEVPTKEGSTLKAEDNVAAQTGIKVEGKDSMQTSEENEITEKKASNEEVIEPMEASETAYPISCSQEEMKESYEETPKTTEDKFENEVLVGTEDTSAIKNADVKIIDDNKSIEIPDTVSIALGKIKAEEKEDSSSNVPQNEGTNGLAEGYEMIHHPLEKTSDVIFDRQNPDAMQRTETTMTVIPKVNEPLPLEKQNKLQETTQEAEAENTGPGTGNAKNNSSGGIKHGDGGEDKIHDSREETSETTLVDSENVSLSDLLQRSTKESLEPGEHMESRERKEEQHIKQDTIQVKGTKTEEENDEEHEGDEPRQTDSGSDAPVIVDVTNKNSKVKPKKSHNILSGVGSKVKHSISKVKKAITGKSSHAKPAPPKGEK